MYLLSNKPKFLLNILQVINEINPIINIKFTAKSIKIQTMNTSHTCYIDCELFSESFLEYKCPKEKLIGIQLKHFCQILELMDESDQVILIIKNDDILEIVRNNRTKQSRFKLKLLSIENNEFNVVTNKTNQLTLKISMNRFINDYKELETINTNVFKISSDDNGINFIGEGEYGELKINLLSGHDAEVNKKDSVPETTTTTQKNKIKPTDYEIIELNKNINASFTLEYFKYIFKISNISTFVTMKINEDFPLMMEFGEKNNYYLNYYIAPKYE
jgi:proliferating cell nuclear antigen